MKVAIHFFQSIKLKVQPAIFLNLITSENDLVIEMLMAVSYLLAANILWVNFIMPFAKERMPWAEIDMLWDNLLQLFFIIFTSL